MMKYVTMAKVGDIAQCVNGHDLYRILTEITPGSAIQSDGFEPIDDAPIPQEGKPIEPCKCGMPWITIGPNGGHVLCSVKRKFEA